MGDTGDPVDRLVEFARALRDEGLSIGAEQVIAFCEAVSHLGPSGLDNLYWAGHAALVNRRGDLETYDWLFPKFFGTGPMGVKADSEEGTPSEVPNTIVTDDDIPTQPGEDADEEVMVGAIASRLEILRHKRFAELTSEERLVVQALMAEFVVKPPTRRTRRMQAVRRGRQPDVRRSLRRALRTDGEVIHRSWRRPKTRPRQMVLLLDVSGSMADYSRALLGFAHAVSRSIGAVEVFCFGTRITRVTDALALRDPDMAIAQTAREVVDWEGGTRIGVALNEFLSRWGRARMARGAVVIICSDGLERDEPGGLAMAMERLGRLAHRIIWINPLMGDTRYQPLARGMAAALPHIDISIAGHNFANLEALSGVISEIGRR